MQCHDMAVRTCAPHTYALTNIAGPAEEASKPDRNALDAPTLLRHHGFLTAAALG